MIGLVLVCLVVGVPFACLAGLFLWAILTDDYEEWKYEGLLKSEF